MFDKISRNEIKMEKDGFGSAEKKGWVTKQGGRVKTWKKRWMVLKDNCLYYFKKPDVSRDLSKQSSIRHQTIENNFFKSIPN